MANRGLAREGEKIDQKFRQLYNPLVPIVDALVFDLLSGKIMIPATVEKQIADVNQRWNYQASIINKTSRTAQASFGAINTRFNKDVAAKEMKLFINAVAKVLEEKYALKGNAIDVEDIVKWKTDGLNPERVCDRRVLSMDPEKVSLTKHIHDWIVIDADTLGHIIICSKCRTRYHKHYMSCAEAKRIAGKLPRTNLGLKLNYFRNYK